MSEEQIVPILKDMQIAYAGVDQTIKNPRHRPKKYQEMNRMILDKHGIEKARFYDSYSWYQQRPMLMDTIYQRVITELNVEIVPLQNKKSKRPKGRVPEAQ